MAGPRSLSRSTKVAVEGGKGKHGKGKGKYRKGRKATPNKDATWDHDNSSSDGERESTTATTAAATLTSTSAGKKRPRGVAASEERTRGGAGKARLASKKPRSAGGEEGSSGGEQSSQDDDRDGEEPEEEAEEEGEGGGESGGGVPVAAKGGMGDVMAKILGQKLDTRTQAPVLAKRKTKAMKEMEQASVKRAESRGKSAVRRANMTQQFVIPDHTTTDYERQLKKIATRGVVALFNAISKRQNQGDGEDAGSKSVAGTAKTAAVKGASRHAFLGMLKSGVKPASRGGAGVDAKRAGGEAATAAGAGWDKDGDGEEDGGRSWSVLKEDYMMGASSMKNWDQESGDSEPDAVGGPDMMSDDDDSD